MKLDIHELMNPGLRKPIAECALKFPHECRPGGGRMKGDWREISAGSVSAGGSPCEP
jgi:hypothetical protein